MRDLIAAIDTAVPSVYGGMTNQSGRVAWRGYRIQMLVSLGPDSRPDPSYAVLRKAAVARCGSRVTDATWVVKLQFPNAQTIFDGVSTAYFVHSRGGWRFWFKAP